MEVSFMQFQAVAKTCPTGIYLGIEIPIEISEKEELPYWDPFNKRIVMSYPNLKKVFEHIKDADDLEMYIRSDLYHEVAHVLITPNGLMSVSRSNPIYKDVINIFEDERIETLTQQLFYGVDFKQSIVDINGFHGEKAGNLMQDFFNICRFRFGKKEHVDKVAEIINKYGVDEKGKFILDSQSNYFGDYQDDMIKFFKEVAKDWLEENEHDKLTAKNGEYDSLSEFEQQGIVDDVLDDMFDNGQLGNGTYVMVDDITINQDGSVSMTVNGEPMEISSEDMKNISEQAKEAQEEGTIKQHDHLTSHESNNTKKNIQKMLETEANRFVDNDLTAKLDKILSDFASRVKNDGSADYRYSGVINPRAVGREDWKIWNYKSDDGPINGYDKLHLSLYIDTSGSFYGNQDKVNIILKSLDTLEKTYPFFEFDLVTCQVGETLRGKDERYIKTGGGNDIDANVWKIHQQLENKNAFNIDIALFDGDAFTDCRGSKAQHAKNFGVWNSSHASIISDDDNENYIKQYAPQAHHLFVNGRNQSKSYADMLFENITTALSLALI